MIISVALGVVDADATVDVAVGVVDVDSATEVAVVDYEKSIHRNRRCGGSSAGGTMCCSLCSLLSRNSILQIFVLSMQTWSSLV